jgi:hypothetical protein
MKHLANWGKRSLSYDSSPQYLSSSLDTDNDEAAAPSLVDDNVINNYVLEKLRSVNKMFRQKIMMLFFSLYL